ncbi:hypothetical protein [Prescottella subtropica]|uniref:hypothetical protein n=1 Tax=Prescottella subtropica TaxID=2545757 RepID=UPI0010F888D9|nr:hypothetical protein [Prescottella subtropica]
MSTDDHTPTWLTDAEPVAATPRKRVPPALRKRVPPARRVAGAVLVVAVIGGAGLVAARSVSLPASSTTGSPRPAEAPALVVDPAVPSPWCVESVEAGRSVGRGPGGTSDGPGAIRAFDHAYYAERDGERVASLMVEPNPVPEIQRWIDAVPAGTEHCVTIAATPVPDVYSVELGLRIPGRSDGVIRQTITVAPSPGGYRIVRVEDA